MRKSIWILRLGLAISVSVTQHLIRCAIAANVFSSNLTTHKRQTFPMVAPQRVAKLSNSPKVIIFPSPVPYYFISDQCLKGDRWTTLFSRNSIVPMDLWSLRTHKTWNIMRGETYVSRNLLANTHLLLHRFKYNKLLEHKVL